MKQTLRHAILASAALTLLAGCAQTREFFDPADEKVPVSPGATAPALGGVETLYSSWAGEDGVLTVAEWDAAVDRRFGEDDVNLAAARWDVDANGIISPIEFQSAVAADDRFNALVR